METLKKDIANYKRKLIKKAKNSGMYENFGAREVSKLDDKHINISSYTDEMNEKRELIMNFTNWAVSFDLSKL